MTFIYKLFKTEKFEDPLLYQVIQSMTKHVFFE